MQKIKLFAAVSNESLDSDLAEIETFVLRLNNSFIDLGLYFSPVMKKTHAGDKTPGDENDGLSRELSGCSVAFFIVETDDRGGSPLSGAESDDGIPAVFKAANDSFNRTGRPKIAVYAKQGAKALDPDLEIYHNTYSHIDTLKLGILMQIKQLDLPGVDIRLEEGKAWQNNDVLLTLENVEMVSGYEELQRLRTEQAEMESRYYEAKAKYAENPEDNEAYDAFCEAARIRNAAVNEIRDVETRLYHMIEGMYEQTSRGMLSKRQSEGYRLAERGRFEEAKVVLDYDGIVSDSRHDEELADVAAKRMQIHVNEQLQLKDVNATLSDWDGVDACFREAVRLEERYNLPRVAMPAYIKFLCDQNRYPEGVSVAERLLVHYLGSNENISRADKGQLYMRLGKLYLETMRTEEAESKFFDALEIYKELAAVDPYVYEAEVAEAYNEFGVFYRDCNRAEEAVEKLKSAIDMWTVLMKRSPGVFDSDVAKVYNNLGLVYRDMNRLHESEEMLKNAIEVFTQMFEQKPDETARMSLGVCYSNLGSVYGMLRRTVEAEEALGSALMHYEYLSERNPDAYEPRLARLTAHFSYLYSTSNQAEKAEISYKKLIDMYHKLVKRSPGAYEYSLAESYGNLGVYYLHQSRFSEAEQMTLISLTMYEKINAADPGRADNCVAHSSTCLGEIYTETLRIGEAEEHLNKGLEIYTRLAAESPDAYEPYLGTSMVVLGKLYKTTGRMSEAARFFREAVAILEKHVIGQGNRAYEEPMNEAVELLKTINELPPAAGTANLFTPEETQIALMMTEGMTQREIVRKLKITAIEVSRTVSAIREKVSGNVGSDPLIDAVTQEYNLTRRESDMLNYLYHNVGNDVIAAELYLSEETVRGHVRNLLNKLSIEKRSQLTQWLEDYGRPEK